MSSRIIELASYLSLPDCNDSKKKRYTQVLINKIFHPKMVNIFLPIMFSISFVCSKEPSHFFTSAFLFSLISFDILNKACVVKALIVLKTISVKILRQNNVESMFIQHWGVDLKFFYNICACGDLVVWTLGFDCLDVGFWLYGRWILIGWMLDFGCLGVGFWLCGDWTLGVRTLDFGCVDVGC